MNNISLLRTTLENLADKEHYLFSVSDFYCLFNNLSVYALNMLLSRAVKNKILERICKGYFIYPKADYEKGYELFHVAARLREKNFCYLSFETVLSKYGVISQIPMGCISLMTTGRRGIINCGKYGKIEFVHTKKSIESFNKNQLYFDYKYKLWCAKVPLAYNDMLTARRSIDLVDKEILNEFI